MKEFYAVGDYNITIGWLRGPWPSRPGKGRTPSVVIVPGYYLRLYNDCYYFSNGVHVEVFPDGIKYMYHNRDSMAFGRRNAASGWRSEEPKLGLGDRLVWDRMMDRAVWLEQNLNVPVSFEIYKGGEVKL